MTSTPVVLSADRLGESKTKRDKNTDSMLYFFCKNSWLDLSGTCLRTRNRIFHELFRQLAIQAGTGALQSDRERTDRALRPWTPALAQVKYPHRSG